MDWKFCYWDTNECLGINLLDEEILRIDAYLNQFMRKIWCEVNHYWSNRLKFNLYVFQVYPHTYLSYWQSLYDRYFLKIHSKSTFLMECSYFWIFLMKKCIIWLIFEERLSRVVFRFKLIQSVVVNL